MKAIVAIDLNCGIGYEGNLLQRIPEDMKFFKETTLGRVVIMGRETFESLPKREPLKDRINIVLSTKAHLCYDGITICNSLKELFYELQKYNTDDVFVIGGEAVYNQLLPYCTEAYVTRINNRYKADKYFTNIDKEVNWELVFESDSKSYNDINYKFLKYKNNMVMDNEI